ncbi:MAG: vWA domain-containing protein, partial [Candidatus Fervidibacter sp.]|uniref:vWA domain-containing protein n=1 Tax=Candidatus Fervidibacter sp. TaxID=3100871 RepID=UPI00404953AA
MSAKISVAIEMRFVNPLWLLLLPVLWGALWWSGRNLMGVTTSRKRFVIALRGIVATLLVLALAGAQMVKIHCRVCTIFVVDSSDSVSEQARLKVHEFIAQSLKRARTEDLVGVILFGRDPMVEITPTKLQNLPNFSAAPDRSATDIASALRLAMALFPDGYSRRIVLLSDGNETHGDEMSVASVARAEAKVGQPFPVRVVAKSTDVASGVLRVDKDGVPVKEMTVNLSPGKNTITTSLRVDKPGVSRFRFVLEVNPDTDPRNNIGMGLVPVKG